MAAAVVVVCSVGQILGLIVIIEMWLKKRSSIYRGLALIIAGLLPIIKIFADRSSILGWAALLAGIALLGWGSVILLQRMYFTDHEPTKTDAASEVERQIYLEDIK